MYTSSVHPTNQEDSFYPDYDQVDSPFWTDEDLVNFSPRKGKMKLIKLERREIDAILEDIKRGNYENLTKLIELHMPLIQSTARRMQKAYCLSENDQILDDLIGEGIIGLHEWLRKGGPSKLKFAYIGARNNCERAMQRFIKDNVACESTLTVDQIDDELASSSTPEEDQLLLEQVRITLAALGISDPNELEEINANRRHLTPQEIKFLRIKLGGWYNEEIAIRMGIEMDEVTGIAASIRQKFSIMRIKLSRHNFFGDTDEFIMAMGAALGTFDV